jgi:hypothetical protein
LSTVLHLIGIPMSGTSLAPAEDIGPAPVVGGDATMIVCHAAPLGIWCPSLYDLGDRSGRFADELWTVESRVVTRSSTSAAFEGLPGITVDAMMNGVRLPE